jgi:hypothetical protein
MQPRALRAAVLPLANRCFIPIDSLASPPIALHAQISSRPGSKYQRRAGAASALSAIAIPPRTATRAPRRRPAARGRGRVALAGAGMVGPARRAGKKERGGEALPVRVQREWGREGGGGGRGRRRAASLAAGRAFAARLGRLLTLDRALAARPGLCGVAAGAARPWRRQTTSLPSTGPRRRRVGRLGLGGVGGGGLG